MAGPILGAILIAAILRRWHRAPRQAGERNLKLGMSHLSRWEKTYDAEGGIRHIRPA